MLTVAIFHLMRKIASGGRKPAMEKSIFAFPPLPSFRSLCLRHFILTSFEKSQNSFANKGRVHWLILPLHKAPFRKIGKWIRQWEGGTHMSIFPSNNAFAENWLRTSKPAGEKLFLYFPPIHLLIISLSSNRFWWWDRDNIWKIFQKHEPFHSD